MWEVKNLLEITTNRKIHFHFQLFHQRNSPHGFELELALRRTFLFTFVIVLSIRYHYKRLLSFWQQSQHFDLQIGIHYIFQKKSPLRQY